jgi:ferric-dicitrate binding protein FerR (iron transport regulator)
MMQDDLFIPDVDMIDCYLAGELSPADTERVRTWADSRAERVALLEVLRNHARAEKVLERSVDLERGARLLWEHGAHAPRRKSARYVPRILPRMAWSAAAAMVFGLLVLIVGWTAGGRHASGRAARSTLTYTTGNGERANIRLPDGNTVVLNVASRLDVPMDYMAGNRSVRIIGEGLFTVQHHTDKPFTVLAGGVATRVLGTSFVVRWYDTDTNTMVAVRDGKVTVGTTVVTANRLVEIGRDGVPHVRPADVSRFTFASGMLTIDDLPLSAAIRELDRWYDADIRLGDTALATQLVKGEFAAGSLTDLAAMLEWTFNVRAVRAGRVLTLFPR